MAFNEKLAKAMLNQRHSHRPKLTALDVEAEKQGDAIRRGHTPIFKGKKLLGKAPTRFAWK